MLNVVMKQDSLKLIKSGDLWAVDFANASDAGKMLDLFGTTIIPTPFFASAPIEMVLETIRASNPNCEVIV